MLIQNSESGFVKPLGREEGKEAMQTKETKGMRRYCMDFIISGRRRKVRVWRRK
jgi:hypothetical protein